MSRDEEYQLMLAEGQVHYDRTETLKETARWIEEQVNILCEPSFDEMDEWSDDEKRAFLARSREMLGRMKVTWEELVRADEEYHRIRPKVNAYFGSEILKDRPRVTRKEFLG
jgi:hypothetical protein